MKAIWNGQIIADSNETIVIEGNHYFPPESVNHSFLQKSPTKTTCHWKGEASYYSLHHNEKVNTDAAWYYPQPKAKAAAIENYIAFWKGVKITD